MPLSERYPFVFVFFRMILAFGVVGDEEGDEDDCVESLSFAVFVPFTGTCEGLAITVQQKTILPVEKL